MEHEPGSCEYERELRKQNRRLRLEIQDRRAELAELQERMRELEAERERLKREQEELRAKQERQAQDQQRLAAENAALKAALARATTTSRNSSKRPSSDIVKGCRARSEGKRKIGGQPGHPKHERRPLGPDEIDRHLCWVLTACPDCGGPLRRDQSHLPQVLQQAELVRKPIENSEHTAPWYWCEKCQKLHCALPLEIERAGLCGPVLTAWIAYLKGGCHASFSTIRHFVRDVLGVRLCCGQLAKVIAKVSAALADSWEELRMLLPLAKLLNVDETGHTEKGQRLWTWCFRARKYVLFKISETRGTAELLEMLGADFSSSALGRRLNTVKDRLMTQAVPEIPLLPGLEFSASNQTWKIQTP